MQKVIDRANNDLSLMERNVGKAEDDLGYNESGIRGFFKPLIGKVMKNKKTHSDSADCSEHSPDFRPTEVFKTSDYFPGQSENKS